MIAGFVTSTLRAVLPLTIFDAHGNPHRVDGVIDTGYNGYLALLTVA